MKIRILFYILVLFSQSASAIPTLSQNVMISGPSQPALESALRVSKEGGNPVDAAVAYALTLSVTHPYFGSLGGGGFALVNMNGTPTALDFRERAPLKTGPDYFSKKNKNSRLGGAAVGVPGVPMGLWDLHKKHGKRPWASLFKEALLLSKSGFPVSGEWYKVTKRKQEKFWTPGAFHLLNKKKQVPLPGDKLVQKGLYNALLKLKELGPKGFYEGGVAVDMIASVNASGGDFTLEDMKAYKTSWRKPLETTYKKNKIYLMPPPSSGGVIIKTAFELAEKLNLGKKKLLSVDELHHLSEVMALSFRGRSLLGDPDFIKNPFHLLFSNKYLNELKNAIKPDSVSKLKAFNDKEYLESNETTHFVVMNKSGQAVSMTVTLNGNYGSGVITKKYGIALNNEMDDFMAHPGKPNMFGLIQGLANKVEAKKRPLSSMSPSLVLKNKKTVLAIGAPGGPRIINGVFQALYRSLENNLDMEQAIFTPRLHHQFLPRVTYYEKNRFSPDVLKALEVKGHVLKPTFGVARVYGVKINDEGLLEGAADYRGEGSVGGH